MHFKTSNIDLEVKYKKAGNELLVPKPQIIMKVDDMLVQEVRVIADKQFLWRGKGIQLASLTKLVDPKTEEEVPSSEALEILDRYTKKYVDPQGNEVDKKAIQYFAVQPDGTEAEVRPFSRTETIEIAEENWIPSTTIEGFEISSVYEIYSPKEDVARKLYEEAERRMKEDKIGITTFSWGGFIQYYVFLVPHFENGKFVWLMKFSERKTQCNYLQDIPAKVKVPIREVPTLSTLPPVQALVVTTKKKKK